MTAATGRGREQVADIQRARMLAAMVEEVAERGVGNVTVADVVARSGVSRRTFYEIFEDREDCFLAAFDNAIEKLANVIVPAYEQKGAWQTKIRSALTALLEYLDREPAAGRLVIVETLGAGHKALEHRRRGIAQIITIVDQGRNESKNRRERTTTHSRGRRRRRPVRTARATNRTRSGKPDRTRQPPYEHDRLALSRSSRSAQGDRTANTQAHDRSARRPAATRYRISTCASPTAPYAYSWPSPATLAPQTARSQTAPA